MTENLLDDFKSREHLHFDWSPGNLELTDRCLHSLSGLWDAWSHKLCLPWAENVHRSFSRVKERDRGKGRIPGKKNRKQNWAAKEEIILENKTYLQLGLLTRKEQGFCLYYLNLEWDSDFCYIPSES